MVSNCRKVDGPDKLALVTEGTGSTSRMHVEGIVMPLDPSSMALPPDLRVCRYVVFGLAYPHEA